MSDAKKRIEEYRKYMKERESENYIKISDCKEGYLYYIDARCGSFGIYSIKPMLLEKFTHNFTVSRFKFDDNFLWIEHHWDDGEPYGTAKPFREIEKVPDEILNGTEKQKLEYLNKFK